MSLETGQPLSIAVIGAGISGLSAAWLLSQRHAVTLYERDDRLGGHTNTVEVAGPQGPVAVDTGFIVYNPETYPNLVGLFDHLGVATQPTDMSFSASLRAGGVEYAGRGLRGLFARPANLASPRFWAMLRDLARFYRQAVALSAQPDAADLSLGELLARGRYAPAFIDDHLLPMAAAIWSATPEEMRAYPAGDFVRFFDSHGLLRLRNRPVWRTVTGGGRMYVRRLAAALRGDIRLGLGVRRVAPNPDGNRDGGVAVTDAAGETRRFDQAVIAAHADQALAMLAAPSARTRRLLGAFRYRPNRAILHSDVGLTPRRRAAWASWNYLQPDPARPGVVTYWMNRLQRLDHPDPLLVTLNAATAATVRYAVDYAHPLFNRETRAAQRALAEIQGEGGVWFCGAYCGAGFHEDGLRAGLAVAEALGGVRRPWTSPADKDVAR